MLVHEQSLSRHHVALDGRGTRAYDGTACGEDLDPNLYGLAISADGLLYVADAGGNTMCQIDPETGEHSLFTVIPNLTELPGTRPAMLDLASFA